MNNDQGLAAPIASSNSADALARFEALVVSQRPTTEPWRPVTDYSVEARTTIEGIHPQLIQDVFAPVHVLDAGCGPDAILVRLLRARGMTVDGVDGQLPRGVSEDHLWRHDLVDDPISLRSRHYDLVICREVLEHLTVLQLRKAITNLCCFSSRYVYVTTRFAKSPQSLLDVDTSDDLDATHITMLHQDFLRLLFVLEGFRRRADLEAKMDWQHKNRVLVYERVR